MKYFVFILGISSLFATCDKKVAIAYLDGSKSKNYTVLSWKQISGIGEIENPTIARTRVGFDRDGINYFELTVRDSLGRAGKDTVKVTVIK